MVVLQQTVKPRVVASWTCISLQVASAQRTDSDLKVVLQWKTKLRVVARPQAGKSLIARSARLYRQGLVREMEHTKDLPIKGQVNTIFGGPCKVGKSCRAHDRYAQEARYPPRVMVHTTNECPSRGIISKLEDIVFTKTDANWVHHPREDALVIIAKIANSLIHRILMDNRSAVNILY